MRQISAFFKPGSNPCTQLPQPIPVDTAQNAANLKWSNNAPSTRDWAASAFTQAWIGSLHSKNTATYISSSQHDTTQERANSGTQSLCSELSIENCYSGTQAHSQPKLLCGIHTQAYPQIHNTSTQAYNLMCSDTMIKTWIYVKWLSRWEPGECTNTHTHWYVQSREQPSTYRLSHK